MEAQAGRQVEDEMEEVSQVESPNVNEDEGNPLEDMEVQEAVVIPGQATPRPQIGGRRKRQRTGNEARQPLDAARGRQRISEIRSKRVSQNSRAAYTSSVVRFIQFVYRNNPFLLTTEFKDLIERDMEEGDPPLPSKRIIRTVLDENSVSWTGWNLPFMALFSLKY